MNEKIKKTFRAMTSAALAGAFVVSSVIGGGADSFVSSSVSFAAESLDSGEGVLSEGTYVVALNRQTAIDNSKENTTAPEHFYGQAILSIDGLGKQTLTIGVENWNLYDAFVPKIQNYNNNGDILPSAVFNNENAALTNFSAYYQSNENCASEEANSWYLYSSDAANKFGDISVDLNVEIGSAFVTFEIEDYTQPVAIQSWLNAPIDGNGSIKKVASLGKEYNDLIVLSINESTITNVSDFSNVENWEYVMRNTSSRYSAMTKTSTQFSRRMMITNPGNSTLRGVIDEAIIQKGDNPDTYTVRYHIANSDFTTFKLLTNVDYQRELPYAWDAWDYWLTGSFEELEVSDDGYLTINYNSQLEALLGKYFFYDNGTTDLRVYLPSICPQGDQLTIENENTGIIIKTDRFSFPNGADFSILENTETLDDTKYFDGITQDKSRQYSSSLYKDAKWYTISIKDKNQNPISNTTGSSVYIPIPDDYNTDNYFAEVIVDGSVISNSYTFFNYNNILIKDGYLVWSGTFDTALSVAIMKIADASDVYGITDDGIYTANAYFMHTYQPVATSMSDPALVKRVYIVVENGVKKMYFKASTVMRGEWKDAYIGDVFCNNPDSEGEVYLDSISYTDFLLDSDGNIDDNAGYNAITEWANVKGGVLTLVDNCYLNEQNEYELAIASPVMQTLGGNSYSEWVYDGLLIWLRFVDLEKCEDSMTLDTILNEYGYGYHPSALLRKIKQAELKLEGKNSYSSESVAKLQSVYDRITESYGSSYDSLSAANLSSNDIEKMITNLDNAIKSLDGITVAGYNAQLDKDITFDFYLSMNKTNLEAAEDGDLTATITKADGSATTVEVGADGKIEFNVAPKEIGQTLKVKIGSYEFTYSVQEYLEKLIWYAENPTEGVNVSEKDAAIAKSLLVYGGYAQDYFVKKDAETNAYVDTERAYANVDNTLPESVENASAFEAPQLGENIKYYGAAVAFDYATDIRLYFTVKDEIENHSFAVNDAAVTPVAVDGGYYIAIENIYANQLGNPFKITVDDTDFQYGVYNYIAAALNATEVKSGALNELQALVKALYQYAELTKTTA